MSIASLSTTDAADSLAAEVVLGSLGGGRRRRRRHQVEWRGQVVSFDAPAEALAFLTLCKAEHAQIKAAVKRAKVRTDLVPDVPTLPPSPVYRRFTARRPAYDPVVARMVKRRLDDMRDEEELLTFMGFR